MMLVAKKGHMWKMNQSSDRSEVKVLGLTHGPPPLRVIYKVPYIQVRLGL